MAVSIPFSDEKYMQLVAEGFDDQECATKMHIKKSIIVREYLPHLLKKAGVATREEAVQYARRKGFGKEIVLPPDEATIALRATKSVEARAFYRALEQHYFQNNCPGCKSYFQYAVLLINSQFYKHMGLFVPSADHDAFELIACLKESDMISVHRDEETYRVTFKHLQPKEGHNDGDNNI
jgi:DNA-binding CsgD family transcriptional regulator